MLKIERIWQTKQKSPKTKGITKRYGTSSPNKIPPSKIWFDPGIGFGKNLKQNIEIMKKINQFKFKGYGLLLGSSRKSWINGIDNSDVSNRLGGSLASALYSYKKGVKMFRVHDVKETYQALKVYKNLCLM